MAHAHSTHACTRTRTHKHTHTHTHARTHTNTQTHAHAHAHAPTLARACACVARTHARTRVRAIASASTNNHAPAHAPTPLLPRTALQAPNSISDGCLPGFKRRNRSMRGAFDLGACVRGCAHTRACVCTHAYLYDHQSHGLLPRALLCELRNSRNSSTNITNGRDL